jgi:DNA polymerase I
LSYETLLCNHKECQKNKVPQTGYWVCEHNRGIVADVIGFIKDIRVQWLKPESKKESSQKEFYQILERSLKVLINASYGVLGSERFQFYCLPVADATTAYGRDSIEKAIQKSQALGITVLYGDTDSVFLQNPTEKQIDEIIQWSREELGVGLEMEKTYRYLVLSERKKNYFGVYPDSSVEVKGLMGKKRNTPPFLQKGFKEVLAILAQVTTKEEFAEAKKQVIHQIRGIYQKLEKKEYSAADLAITIQLTQPIHRYKVQAQHVKAAAQLNDHYKKKNMDLVKAGQLIRFVKTRTSDRVTPLLLMTDTSKVDVKAYKSMVDSTFDQLFGALDIEVEEIATGQVNLMEFFS